MNRSLVARAFLALGAFATPILAQEPPKASTPKPLTPEASLNLRNISDLQFSPGGSRLAFVVTEPAKGERRARHVWIYDKQSSSTRQFTYSAKSEFSPRWSPDGKQLAFLSDRDEQTQFYAMRSDGGEASALTKGKRGVRSFAWSPDGKQIAFLAPNAKSDAEEKKEKDKDDARVVDKDDKQPRLWLLTLATSEAKAITDTKWEISELAWLKTGDRLVVSATDHPESDQETHRIFSISIPDGSQRLIFAPHGPFHELQVSPDGATVSYIGSRVDGPSPYDLMLMDIDKRAARILTGASLDRAISEHRWMKDGSMLALYADGFR